MTDALHTIVLNNCMEEVEYVDCHPTVPMPRNFRQSRLRQRAEILAIDAFGYACESTSANSWRLDNQSQV